jgi:segregation and condensation protein B
MPTRPRALALSRLLSDLKEALEQAIRGVNAMAEEENLAPIGPDVFPSRPIAEAGSKYASLLPGEAWEIDGESALGTGINQAPATDSTPEGAAEIADNAAVPASVEPIPLRRIVEAMLFLGGEPLQAEKACSVVRGLTADELTRTIDELNAAYRSQGRPYRIRPWRNGYELALRPRFLHVMEKLQGVTREARLAPSAIEVLSLVAYRQPITKQDVDSLRGAESGAILRQLVRRGLLAVVHEESETASPTKYRTTQRFLELFQLRGPEDLPLMGDLQRL